MAKKKADNTIVDEPKIDNTAEQTTEQPEAPVKTLSGMVTNCVKLNVRKKPSIKSKPIGVINSNTQVTVYPDESASGWYKVNADGVGEGYCMAKYIAIKP